MRHRTLSALLGLSLSVGACGSGFVPREVEESERDASGRYDARWRAIIDNPGGRQQLSSGWHIDCPAAKQTLQFEVDEGRLVSNWDLGDEESARFDTLVDGEGRFRLSVPLETRTRAASGTLSDGRTVLILQGTLDEDALEGRFVRGIRQFQNNGCTYPVRFERAG